MIQYLSNPKTTLHLKTHTWIVGLPLVKRSKGDLHGGQVDDLLENNKLYGDSMEIDSHKGGNCKDVETRQV